MSKLQAQRAFRETDSDFTPLPTLNWNTALLPVGHLNFTSRVSPLGVTVPCSPVAVLRTGSGRLNANTGSIRSCTWNMKASMRPAAHKRKLKVEGLILPRATHCNLRTCPRTRGQADPVQQLSRLGYCREFHDCEELLPIRRSGIRVCVWGLPPACQAGVRRGLPFL